MNKNTTSDIPAPLDCLVIPFGGFRVIYADPPWSYNDKMAGHSFSLDHEYETQHKNWIARLPIKKIASKDALLFMWAVSPQLPEAIEVMNSWGFKYVTVAFCWSKHTKTGKKVSNLGRWTMGNIELCLLGKRGKPKRLALNVKQLIEAERTRHSAKPPETRNRIIEIAGDVPRIELFARGTIPGWTVWGNEV